MKGDFELERNKKKKKSCKLEKNFVLGVKVPGHQISDLELALKEFKRQVKDSGIMLEFKARQEYLKPSVKRRRVKIAAIRRQKMEESDNFEDV